MKYHESNNKDLFLCGLLISTNKCSNVITRFRIIMGSILLRFKAKASARPTLPIFYKDAHPEKSRKRTDAVYKYLNKYLKEKNSDTPA